LLCAVGAILSLAFANSIEHDRDADALKTAGDLVETRGMNSGYSTGVWTNRLDMTLDTPLDTSDAAIIQQFGVANPAGEFWRFRHRHGFVFQHVSISAELQRNHTAKPSRQHLRQQQGSNQL